MKRFFSHLKLPFFLPTFLQISIYKSYPGFFSFYLSDIVGKAWFSQFIERRESGKNCDSLTCLGVTAGIRMSSVKSDRPKEITGWSLSRHSLERDLLVSLYLKKKEDFFFQLLIFVMSFLKEASLQNSKEVKTMLSSSRSDLKISIHHELRKISQLCSVTSVSIWQYLLKQFLI